ncbi:MAG TPA: hypothetical protein VLJ76_02775, partial [Gaiellaceae bacterium]|nr:hypothetical protein [Gaiellaceae bacterium]
MRRTPTRSAGEQLERIFDAHDFLDGLEDSELLDRAFRPAAGARLVHGATFEGSEYGSDTAQLSLEHGAGLDGRFPAEA